MSERSTSELRPAPSVTDLTTKLLDKLINPFLFIISEIAFQN